MHTKRSSTRLVTLVAALPLSLLLSGNALAVLDPTTEADYPLKLLGKYVFFDKISEPQRMACVTCHEPSTGGTGGNSGVNLHQVVITGADPHTRGNLKPPTNMYANLIPPFHPCADGGLLGRQNYCGGNFYSGRAEGAWPPIASPGATKHLGDEVFYKGTVLDASLLPYAAYFGATADQALNPIPNVVEQNKEREDVCLQVENSAYAPLYETVWGEPIDCSDTPVDVQAPDVASETEYDISFKRLMLAVCAWQASRDNTPFSAPRDVAIANEIADYGVATFPLDDFTCKENYGHDLFYAGPFGPRVAADRNYDCVPDQDGEGDPILLRGANCAFCHANGGPAHDDGTSLEETYTNNDYHKIDVPFNPEIPDICFSDTVACDPFLQPLQDHGLSSHLAEDAFGLIPPGFFKTPTLRNVDKRKDEDFIKAFMHNGYFKTLERVVHFYNTAAIGLATANSFGISPDYCPDVEDPSYESGFRSMTDKEAEANNCWPAPEFPGRGAIPFLLGNLGLTTEDEAAIVAYLKTLTDLETAVAPLPYKGLDDVRVREEDDGGKKGNKK